MFQRFKIISVSIFFIFSLFTSISANTVTLEGAEVGKWTMDFDAASKLAKEKNLPMLLNFTGSDWCGWCKLMDRNVFAKTPFKNYAIEELVLVTLDFPRNKSIVPAKYVTRNYELQNQFGVSGYPTYIVLDSDGKTVLGKLGAGRDKTPESFIEELKDMFRFRDVEIEKYAKTLPPEKAKNYKTAIADMKSVKKEFDAWLDTGPLRNPENEKIYNDFLAKLKITIAKVNEF